MTANARRTPTRAEVDAALRAMREACKPTARELAEQRMRDAKTRFSDVAARALTGDSTAEADGVAAFAEVEAARAALAAINSEGSHEPK